MTKILHIALLIETSREYARRLLRGIAQYHHEHGPWSIYLAPHGLAPGGRRVGDRAAGDEASYPDDDLKAVLTPDGAWRFAHKDGTPY